jgi:hypothetical protein
MTKEEIKTFIEKYPSINVNEIIEVFLKDRTSLIGFFDLQELKNEQQNKWTFANVFNYNQTILNGEDILKIYFYRDGEKLEDDGIEIQYNSDGTYTIV